MDTVLAMLGFNSYQEIRILAGFIIKALLASRRIRG